MTRKKDFIESLSSTERDVFADMIMRSIRGSWNQPERRTEILDTLADYEMEVYDDLQSQVDGYKSNAYSGRPYGDGRYFRSYYGKVDIPELVSEEKVRLMASHIPDDLSWDDFGIKYEFDNGND